MSNTTWVLLTTFTSNPMLAYRLARHLNNNGVPATVGGSRNTIGGLAVHIPEGFYSKAREIQEKVSPTPYEEWLESKKTGPPPDRGNPHCNECLGTTEHDSCPLPDEDIIYCRRRVYGLNIFDKLYAWYVGQFRKVG